MKICGGECRGRSLFFPARSIQRPTSDFLREALFNLLASVNDQSFLDLFAGSGAVGLEAASRGASPVFFVEKDKTLIRAIRQNIDACGYSNQTQILGADVRQALKDLFERGVTFDVIFADPPYQREWIVKTISGLAAFPVLTKGGRIVLQHSTREPLGPLPPGWIQEDHRKYGDNALTFIGVTGS